MLTSRYILSNATLKVRRVWPEGNFDGSPNLTGTFGSLNFPCLGSGFSVYLSSLVPVKPLPAHVIFEVHQRALGNFSLTRQLVVESCSRRRGEMTASHAGPSAQDHKEKRGTCMPSLRCQAGVSGSCVGPVQAGSARFLSGVDSSGGWSRNICLGCRGGGEEFIILDSLYYVSII